MQTYKFPCGCEFEITNPDIKSYDGLPGLKVDFNNVNYECEKSWEIFHYGDTKGVFQLETNLGRKMSKEVSPENIEELSALISLIRPGILKAIVDGKSMADRYIDRKHDREPIVGLDDSLNEILEPTYQVFLYQEQIMKISQIIAGFSLQEADELRKGVGTKDAELLTKVGEKFINGCEATKIVDKAKAEEIWGYIVKGARYLFNKCLAPSTLVETKTGFKTLEEIEIGETIKCPSDDMTKDEYVEITDKIDQGEQEVYEIQLSSGKVIQCTMSHKFMCEDMKVRPLREILKNNHSIMCESD